MSLFLVAGWLKKGQLGLNKQQVGVAGWSGEGT